MPEHDSTNIYYTNISELVLREHVLVWKEDSRIIFFILFQTLYFLMQWNLMFSLIFLEIFKQKYNNLWVNIISTHLKEFSL